MLYGIPSCRDFSSAAFVHVQIPLDMFWNDFGLRCRCLGWSWGFFGGAVPIP